MGQAQLIRFPSTATSPPLHLRNHRFLGFGPVPLSSTPPLARTSAAATRPRLPPLARILPAVARQEIASCLLDHVDYNLALNFSPPNPPILRPSPSTPPVVERPSSSPRSSRRETRRPPNTTTRRAGRAPPGGLTLPAPPSSSGRRGCWSSALNGDGAAREGARGRRQRLDVPPSTSSFTLILRRQPHREQRRLCFVQPSFKPLPFTLSLKAAKVILDLTSQVSR